MTPRPAARAQLYLVTGEAADTAVYCRRGGGGRALMTIVRFHDWLVRRYIGPYVRDVGLGLLAVLRRHWPGWPR